MKIILDGVNEYCESFAVELRIEKPCSSNKLAKPRLVVAGINEGGFNCVHIDAEELYNALVAWMIEKRIATDGYPLCEACFGSISEYVARLSSEELGG